MENNKPTYKYKASFYDKQSNGKIIVSDVVYYFDKNMNEVGFKTPISNKINTSTKGRKWDKELFKRMVKLN